MKKAAQWATAAAGRCKVLTVADLDHAQAK